MSLESLFRELSPSQQATIVLMLEKNCEKRVIPPCDLPVWKASWELLKLNFDDPYDANKAVFEAAVIE